MSKVSKVSKQNERKRKRKKHNLVLCRKLDDISLARVGCICCKSNDDDDDDRGKGKGRDRDRDMKSNNDKSKWRVKLAQIGSSSKALLAATAKALKVNAKVS